MISESFAEVRHLCLKPQPNRADDVYGVKVAAYNAKLLFCVVHNAANLGAGSILAAINMTTDFGIIYGNVVRDNDGKGITMSGRGGCLCNTVINNGDVGIYSGNTSVIWSNYAANNTNSDYRDETGYASTCGWNSSKDTSSDLGGDVGNNYKNNNDLITGGELDSDYLPTEHISWSGGAGDNAGRSVKDDITNDADAQWRMKEFVTDPHPLLYKDILGNDRPSSTDAAWDVGACEYVEEGVSIPVFVHHYKEQRMM